MRSLSPEEAELWSRVAATIRPLSRSSSRSSSVSLPQDELKAPVSLIGAKDRRSVTAAAPSPKQVPIGERTLDGTWDKRLRSGMVEPDSVLDLHGLNLDRAWTAIDRRLDEALARGERLILLITGHHRPGNPPVERGRIRAAVHDWLAASRHSADIAAVRGAHRRHGGGGSLYLILRRRTRPR